MRRFACGAVFSGLKYDTENLIMSSAQILVVVNSSSARRMGQGARAAYAKRLVVALAEMQEDDAAGRWQFSESELLALAEAKAVDGALTY